MAYSLYYLWILLIPEVLSQATTDACAAKLYNELGFTYRDTWQDVPQNRWGYDILEEEFTEDYGTPCGFKVGEIQEDNNPGFCLSVNGVQDRNVQVLLESQEPGVRMCIKTKSPEGAVVSAGALSKQCGEGRVRACFPAESSNFNPNGPLEFYITADPPTAQMSFWYKVQHSLKRDDELIADSSAINNVDMWCSMIEGTEQMWWPDHCIEKDFQTPPPITRTGLDFNNGHIIMPYIVYAMLLCVAFLLY